MMIMLQTTQTAKAKVAFEPAVIQPYLLTAAQVFLSL